MWQAARTTKSATNPKRRVSRENRLGQPSNGQGAAERNQMHFMREVIRKTSTRHKNPANIPKRAVIDSALLRLASAIPPHERTAVVDHAIDSRSLSFARPETAAWLSLVAYVRHTFTDYDELLAEG